MCPWSCLPSWASLGLKAENKAHLLIMQPKTGSWFIDIKCKVSSGLWSKKIFLSICDITILLKRLTNFSRSFTIIPLEALKSIQISNI